MEWKPDEIKALRKKLSLSQRQFAERLGVKRLTIARWESNKTRPNPEYVAMLEKLVPDTTDTKVVSPPDTIPESDTKNVSGKQDFVSPPDTNDTTQPDTPDTQKEIYVSGEQENVSGESKNCITPDTKLEPDTKNVSSPDTNSKPDTNVTGKSDRVTGDRPSKFDPNYVTNVLELLHGSSDGIVEVRIFPNERYLYIPSINSGHRNGRREYVGKVVSGYYTDLEKIAQDVQAFDGRGNIYFTLNPVNPDLLARAANRLKFSVETTTKDEDIIIDRWLPIDIDPFWLTVKLRRLDTRLRSRLQRDGFRAG